MKLHRGSREFSIQALHAWGWCTGLSHVVLCAGHGLSSSPFPECTLFVVSAGNLKESVRVGTSHYPSRKPAFTGTSLQDEFHSGLRRVRSSISVSSHGPLGDIAWLPLGSSVYIPARSWLQAGGLGHGRTHLVCFLSLRKHSPASPVIQFLEQLLSKVFPVF